MGLANLGPAGGYDGKEVWVAKGLVEYTHMLDGEFERMGPRLEDAGDFVFLAEDGFEGHRLVDEDEPVNEQFHKDIGIMKIEDVWKETEEFVYEHRIVLILVELYIAIMYNELGNADQIIGRLCQLQSLPIDDVRQEGETDVGHDDKEPQSSTTDRHHTISQAGMLNTRTIQHPAFPWRQGLDEMV